MNLSHESNISPLLTVQKRARKSDLVAPNKKIKLSRKSEYEGETFSDPPNHFVLCGRGERTNRHLGNKLYRRLVDLNKPLYHSSDRKIKGLIATSIVQAVFCQNPPGSFIREDKKSGLWFDVGIERAIKKTSQALRENISERKEVMNDKQDHDDDQSKTETDDSEYEHEDSSQDRDASPNNTLNDLPSQDFSSARAVTNDEDDEEFSSRENDEYEGFNHVVVANLDFLSKDDLNDGCHLAHNMIEVPPPPVFTHGTSDWTLTSLGSVFEDMVADMPPSSAVTYGTSNWTSKNVSSVQEVLEVLAPPALNSYTSDLTLKSISSILSDGAHYPTNNEGKTVYYD